MKPFTLQSEIQGQSAAARRRRNMRRGFLAKTWSLWFCWSMHMPEDPPWSGCGMIWKYKGEIGLHHFGHN